MCKVMILKGIQDSAAALEFMKAVAPEMSKGNTDGIGYSAINSQNKLFMEKWHNNSKFLNTEEVITESNIGELKTHLDALSKYMYVPTITKNYTNYGEVTRDDLRTVTMHTRFATCGKTFENTHPFVDNEMSLIHNGVLSNADKLNLNKISTCDSENALQLYNNMGVNLSFDENLLQSFLDRLKGYWAFGILAKDVNGNYMLDVVREGANLYWTDIPELGENCSVFATTMDIIREGLKALNLPPRDIYFLPESDYCRYDAVTGEYLGSHKLYESILNETTWGGYYYQNKTNKRPKPALPEKTYTETRFDKKKDDSSNIEDYDLSDDLKIENFYDTEEPLIDRLYDYDKLMSTTYAVNYEDLPKNAREFLEKREEENYIIFDDVLELITKYCETLSYKEFIGLYQTKKRG